MAELETCACPGCDQPVGSKKCGACKSTPYCCGKCQTEDWPRHREECPGHLRKMGMAHLGKAKSFFQESDRNWPQILRYADLALTKLKLLKDRSLAGIQILDEAQRLKFNALNFMDRDKEALECATERYKMWATTFMRNPDTVMAAFDLIEILIHNKEHIRAHLIASTVHEMTTHPETHDIPEDKQQPFLAQAAYFRALAILNLVQSGDIPPEEKQKAGEEAISLARKALGIHTQLYGAESDDLAADMATLARVLNYFNDVDNDEAIRLFEQSTASYSRVQGSLSLNVAVNKYNLASAYFRRAERARTANDLDRQLANLELALPLYRESARIYRAVNHVGKAVRATAYTTQIEERIRQVAARRAAAAAAITRG